MVPRQPPFPAILIDTRDDFESTEKRKAQPYTFIGYKTVTRALATGDYSLAGYEDRVTVERKTKEDAYKCVGKARKRFEECLGRLGRLQSPCIVIEASLDDFCVPPSYTKIGAAKAAGSYISWAQEYRIQVFWCPSREWAERVTLKWLMAWWRHHLRDTMTAPKSVLKPTTTAPPGTTSTG